MPPISLNPSSESTPTDAPLRILLAEDHPHLAKFMVLLLERSGFQVESVSSGEQVYPLAVSFQPHFALLDIGLPGMNGYEVAAAIRSDPGLDRLVIIAVTAYGPSMHADRYPIDHFDHYLTKPVDFDHLLPLLVAH